MLSFVSLLVWIMTNSIHYMRLFVNIFWQQMISYQTVKFGLHYAKGHGCDIRGHGQHFKHQDDFISARARNLTFRDFSLKNEKKTGFWWKPGTQRLNFVQKVKRHSKSDYPNTKPMCRRMCPAACLTPAVSCAKNTCPIRPFHPWALFNLVRSKKGK